MHCHLQAQLQHTFDLSHKLLVDCLRASQESEQSADAKEESAGLHRKSSPDALQPPRALVSKKDLEAHFGYSLADAALKLGVCKTTIKRACRSVC